MKDNPKKICSLFSLWKKKIFPLNDLDLKNSDYLDTEKGTLN